MALVLKQLKQYRYVFFISLCDHIVGFTLTESGSGDVRECSNFALPSGMARESRTPAFQPSRLHTED